MELSPSPIAHRKALLMLLWLLGATASSGLAPDSRLLSLVVPGTQLVAGMRAPTYEGEPDSFLLITHNNSVDLEEFFALTGSDPSRIIHQVIFTAASDTHGDLTEHGMLAGGHFDRDQIFRSSHATPIQYRGISVLVVPPFERERDVSHRLRWFTVISTDVVLFGTVATVQQELDRHLAGSKSDDSLVQKLSRLRQDDDTWCSLSIPGQSEAILRVLGVLDPELAASMEQGGSFQFGIRTNWRVEFEYEIAPFSGSVASGLSTSLAKSLAGSGVKTYSRLPRMDIAQSESHLHGVVKVSRPRYDAWLAEVSTRWKINLPSLPTEKRSQGAQE
jgi:hypothetical protein